MSKSSTKVPVSFRKSLSDGSIERRLLWVFAAGALAIVASILLVHLLEETPGVTGDKAPPSKTSLDEIRTDTVARIAGESRGMLPPPIVEAAPLAIQDDVSQAANAYQSSTLPDGYSLVGFNGEMNKAAIRDRGDDSQKLDDGLDWLGSPTSVETLAAQAATAGRGWSFGWIRMAEDTRRSDLAKLIEGAGVRIVGSAGRLLRAQLPGDIERLVAIVELPEVDGLGALPVEAKLRAFEVPSVELPGDEPTPVFVTLMTDDVDGRWRRELEALGATVGRYDPHVRVYTANVTRVVLDSLAPADFVLAIEPIGVVTLNHDTAVPAMGADTLRTYGDLPGIFTGTGGASVPIGVMDSGLNVNHPDISEHRTSICGVNLFWQNQFNSDQDLWVDRYGHGTHVTGTIAGNGFLAPRFAGMAPSVQHIRFAKLTDFDYERSPFILEDVVNRAMGFLAEESNCEESDKVRPLIVNMSLGGSSKTFVGRGVAARKLDAMVWGYRQLYVVAQSNTGTEGFSNFAAAKNSLAVGAVFDDGEAPQFSSLGPTFDGRLAPQVVATGVGVCSAEGNGKGAGYICSDGTSMAAPSVAGVAALLLDSNPDYQSQPALARARLMASAVRPDSWLEEAAMFPSTNTSGPGNLQAVYGLGKASARMAVLDRNQADGWTGGGAVAEVEDESEYTYTDIEVPEGASRLDVVLTWDEPPTEAIATPVLNDLDLWLDRDADCEDGPCGEQSSESRIDNVEWIIVRNPEPGTYRAKVAPRRIYTAPPKAAISWTVIRGASTPNLAMTVEETMLNESEDQRGLGVAVEVTTDAYVASGAQLHFECRGEGTDCDALTVTGASVEREDGLTRDASKVVSIPGDYPRNQILSPVAMTSRISLGEVAVDENQAVTFDVTYSGDNPVHLYLTASAWNARGASHAVAVLPPGSDSDTETGNPVGVSTNDDFANTVRLAAEEGSLSFDLLRATPEPGEPALHQDYGRPLGSLWYEWTAPSTDLVRFSVASTSRASMEVYLDFYRGDRIADLDHILSNWRTELVSVTAEGNLVERIIFTDAVLFAEAGVTYRVRVAHGGPSVPMVLRWSQGARPGNDDFLAAEVLSGPKGRVEGTNLGATLESGESFGPAAATTWYRWTAPVDGSWNFKIDTDYILHMAAFTGTEVANLRLVSGLPTRTATFKARSGDEYWIAVASRDANVSGGSYGMSWEKVFWLPEPGDHFAQVDISRGFFTLGSHTVEPGEPEASGVRTRWWSWTAPGTGRFTWKLSSFWSELTVAAFAGDTLENLELVGSTGSDVTSREFSFVAMEDERYWLSVGWPAGDYSAYTSPSASGRLVRGLTPLNDELEGAIALGSTRGLSSASNAYATTAAGELKDQLGHSTLWWTYEAPTAGWYEFYTMAIWGTEQALIVYEIDANGSLYEIDRSRVGKVVFRAEPGKQYAIRASSVDGSYGRSMKLYWKPVGAQAWLRYLGSFADTEDTQGNAVQLIDAGSLAFVEDGSDLFTVSPAGLTVFERDSATGNLTNGESIDDDLAGSFLVHDPKRDRLIANRCETWRVFVELDGTDPIEGSDLTVVGDPASCGRRLLLDPEGTFLYRIVPEMGIEGFSIRDDGLSYEETTQIAGIKDAAIAQNGDYVYAVYLDGNSSVRTFRRNQENGSLRQEGENWGFWGIQDMDTLALADNKHLFLIRKSNGFTGMYDVQNGAPSKGANSISLLHSPELSQHLARPFQFATGRSSTPMVDVFGTSVAAGIDFQHGEIDLLANGQQDRFGNQVPLFGAPNGLASSPDGRHVYVSSYQHGIVAFERVGAGVEPEDPYLLLDILKVSSGLVSFATVMDSEECIDVTDLEHNGVTYTVLNSKWQLRANADWPWTDEAGTTSMGEICPQSLTEPGHYRLVVEMNVDEETRLYTSNILVKDDHGDSVDEATTVEIPSVTTGWLDPDDADYFRLELTQTGRLTIHSESWIDTEGYLLDENGGLIVRDLNSGTDSNFRIDHNVDAGTYHVKVVNEFNIRHGAYTVHVELEI